MYSSITIYAQGPTIHVISHTDNPILYFKKPQLMVIIQNSG